MITYEQAKKDHETLWAIDAAFDMTGGYVDSEDLDAMLRNPTKTMARRCLCRQIDYWFRTGTQRGFDNATYPASHWAEEYPEIIEIAERHCIDFN